MRAWVWVARLGWFTKSANLLAAEPLCYFPCNRKYTRLEICVIGEEGLEVSLACVGGPRMGVGGVAHACERGAAQRWSRGCMGERMSGCKALLHHFGSIMYWQGVFDVPIYGRVSNMGLFSVEGEATQRLFLLTEKYQFAVLKFDPDQGAWRCTGCLLLRRSPRQAIDLHHFFCSPPNCRAGELVTCASGDVSDRVGRPVQGAQLCEISPRGDVIALHLYDGHIKVLKRG